MDRPTKRRLRVQQCLWLSGSPAVAGMTWEALTAEARLAAVAALARVMAKSINETEEQDDE